MKIHYVNCYIQFPSDNIEMLKLDSAALEFSIDYFQEQRVDRGDPNQMKYACGEFANVWEGNKKECTGCYLKRRRGNNK